MTDVLNTWAAGSLAVIYPVESAPAVLTDLDDPDRIWDLAGLRRRSQDGRTQPLSSPNRVVWDPIQDGQFVRAVRPERYRLSRRRDSERPLPPLALNLVAAVPDDACSLSAIELFQYDERPGRPAGTYVVLHVELTGAGLVDPAAVVSFFAHPTRPGKRGEESKQPRPRADDRLVAAMLGEQGVQPAETAPGDPYRRPFSAFVISHLVPQRSGALPPHGLVGHDAVADARVWAWRLAGGSNLTLDRESGPEAAASGFWIGSSWCHPTQRGVAVIGTRGIDALPTTGEDREGSVWWLKNGALNVEHVAVEGYTHRPAVDFTILALRQTSFLRRHATELSSLTADDWTDGAPYAKVAEQRRDLLRFRNTTWFVQVPEDDGVSRLVRHLHRAFGADELYAEIHDEQEELAGSLALAAADAASRRQGALETAVALLGAGLAAPTFVYGYAQTADPTPNAWLATAVSLLGVLVVWALLWLTIRHVTRPARRRPPPAAP